MNNSQRKHTHYDLMGTPLKRERIFRAIIASHVITAAHGNNRHRKRIRALPLPLTPTRRVDLYAYRLKTATCVLLQNFYLFIGQCTRSDKRSLLHQKSLCFRAKRVFSVLRQPLGEIPANSKIKPCYDRRCARFLTERSFPVSWVVSKRCENSFRCIVTLKIRQISFRNNLIQT